VGRHNDGWVLNMDQPTYNHTRGDSPLTPCDICRDLQYAAAEHAAAVGKQLAKSVTVLKERVHRELQAALSEFQASTGLSPNGIGISMMEVTCQNDPLQRYVLGEVRVSLGDL
jgi:hypothetical protein